jgi:hypothetical protein
MMATTPVFFTWPINETTQLRVSVQKWHGRWALDIRKFWIKPGDEGFTPTKLGVKVYMDQLPAFVAGVVEGAREVERLSKHVEVE